MPHMAARWLAFAVWGVVLATATGWIFGLLAKAPAAPTHTVSIDTAPSLRSDLTRLFGAAPAADAAPAVPAADARFKLLGVVAASRPAFAGESLALIAVDGKPARAVRMGGAIGGDWVLHAVNPRSVELAQPNGAARVRLELAPAAAAATATLPPAATVAPDVLPAVPVQSPAPPAPQGLPPLSPTEPAPRAGTGNPPTPPVAAEPG